MDDRLLWQHRAFDDMLGEMEAAKKISRSRIADVLARFMIASPTRVPQSDIAQGLMLAVPFPLPADAVSRATHALTSMNMLTAGKPRADRPGRPYTPLELGSSRWAVVGVKIGHEAGRAVSLDVLVLGLNGEPLDVSGYHQVDDGSCRPYNRPIEESADLVEELAQVIEEICNQPAVRQRYILGVGVELAGHVSEGTVIEASHHGMKGLDLGLHLSRRIDSLAERLWKLPTERSEHRRPLPVLIDNDINVLAVHEVYHGRFPEEDIAVIAVFDDGIGSALIINGRVYRGARGMAGEIGHCPVALKLPGGRRPGDIVGNGESRRTGEGSTRYPTFLDQCHCGGHQHLDCYATPVRILGELGKGDLEEDFPGLARAGADGEEELTPELRRAFETAGESLGFGISSLINLVNPARVLLYLPPTLAGEDGKPLPGSAAEIYRQGIEETLKIHAFSDAAKTPLVVEPLEREWRRYFGAKSAGIRVLDGLIQHAKHRCKCYRPLSDLHYGAPGAVTRSAELDDAS